MAPNKKKGEKITKKRKKKMQHTQKKISVTTRPKKKHNKKKKKSSERKFPQQKKKEGKRPKKKKKRLRVSGPARTSLPSFWFLSFSFFFPKERKRNEEEGKKRIREDEEDETEGKITEKYETPRVNKLFPSSSSSSSSSGYPFLSPLLPFHQGFLFGWFFFGFSCFFDKSPRLRPLVSSSRAAITRRGICLPSFTGFYRVLPGFSLFFSSENDVRYPWCRVFLFRFLALLLYRDLPSFTEFYRVLPGFAEFLIKFYRVLLGLISFYRV